MIKISMVNFLLYPFLSRLLDYLIALSICHTIITETKDGEIIYNVKNFDSKLFLTYSRLPRLMNLLLLTLRSFVDANI